MADPEDIEALAAQEHRSWIKWTCYMLDEIEKEMDGWCYEVGGLNEAPELFKHLSCIQRWKKQMKTPYEDLSEKEKESDREVVREKLPLYRPLKQEKVDAEPKQIVKEDE